MRWSQLGDNVSSLSFKSFGSGNGNEKKIIVQKGRPMPKLEIKTRDMLFQDDWYTRKDWLCGSEGKKCQNWLRDWKLDLSVIIMCHKRECQAEITWFNLTFGFLMSNSKSNRFQINEKIMSYKWNSINIQVKRIKKI